MRVDATKPLHVPSALRVCWSVFRVVLIPDSTPACQPGVSDATFRRYRSSASTASTIVRLALSDNSGHATMRRSKPSSRAPTVPESVPLSTEFAVFAGESCKDSTPSRGAFWTVVRTTSPSVNKAGSQPSTASAPFVVSEHGLPSSGTMSRPSSPQSNPRSGRTSGKSRRTYVPVSPFGSFEPSSTTSM